MSPSVNSPWLHRFAWLLATATLALLALGGLVTSHGVGLAVPDWPNTYGYNLFLFPVSQWLGGILYEHTHRLMAVFVGLLTTILAAWMWLRETRGRERWFAVGAIFLVLLLMGVRSLPVYIALAGLALALVPFCLHQARRPSAGLRWWGLLAFAAVVLQGVLGGLRVVLLRDEIGIFHATLAQLFFVVVCAIVLFTSAWWQNSRRLGAPEAKAPEDWRTPKASPRAPASWTAPVPWRFLPSTLDSRPSLVLSRALGLTALLVLVQLVLGATMRHQHAGLAIPDFPLAYGKIWPAMDPASVARYNQQRMEITAVNPITAFQIRLQMTHRIVAVLILGAVAFCAWSARRQLGGKHPLSKLALVWLGLILAQACLGATTIWSDKAADVATAHVLAGALSLALGATITIISVPGFVSVRPASVAASQVEPLSPAPFGAQPSVAAGLK
jgi:cytochrome c oxidase assembly protein subunit 15